MSVQKDNRLEKVEEITIEWETFKKAFKRNYLLGGSKWQSMRNDRSFVLRLYPPFQNKMKAEYHESMQGRHYNNEWNEKPFHIKPELIVLEGIEGNFFNHMKFPTEMSVRNALSDEEIQDGGGIEDCLEVSRKMFWDELKYDLPDTLDIGLIYGYESYEVDLIWTGIEE